LVACGSHKKPISIARNSSVQKPQSQPHNGPKLTKIENIEQLRKYYRPAQERALAKQLSRLELHSRRFIELSPFIAISSCGADGRMDVSPRGEKPGFVHVLDETTIAIPDRPGNNRLDTLENLVSNSAIGLIFMVPGINEVMRLNGVAEIRTDEFLLEKFRVNNRPPATVILVQVEEVYMHCAKAITRSRLWDIAAQVERSVLPTMSEIIRNQIGSDISFESQVEMERRHKKQLY
jgi:PPOX class probable FMN-dependent enzyme